MKVNLKLLNLSLTELFVINTGVQLRYNALLKIFCTCMSHLLAIVCDGSTVQGGFELPTRLSVAAADLILSLTEALTRTNSVFNCSDDKQKAAGTGERNRRVTLLPSISTKKKVNKISKSSDYTGMEMKLLLWDHLDNLIILVERLTAWSRKSRPLHAKALERVRMWLLATQENYIHVQTKTDSEMLKSGVLLFSSCWKHYGMLLHLEDHKFAQHYTELFEQYLSGIQFYADNCAEESARNKESERETIIFFLNCIALLLGRLHGKQFETTIEEYGSRLSQAILSQLNSVDDEVIDSSLCIFKAVIFRTNCSLSKQSADIRQITAQLPMLLHLLDERDSAAKAVIKLFAEYCSISSDTQCLEEILKHLISGNVSQKRNAVDFISDLIHMSMESDTVLPPPIWQHLSCHLLEFLQDEQMVINTQASNLIPLIDPSFTLPALVCLIYSPLERVHSLASGALVALLKSYKHSPDVICMLLDCLSKPSQNTDISDTADGVEGKKTDIDRVLKLLPEWSKMVEDWKVMIGPLIDKLFAEPSNAVIVRFLSSISEHLASAADFVFQRIISYSQREKDPDKGVYPNYDAAEGQLDLFNRLCPLLIVRLLPLQVFNDLNSYVLYDELPTKLATHDNECLGTQSTECVAGLLINRALSKFEFEDVRRLAAELCGRIHPKAELLLSNSHGQNIVCIFTEPIAVDTT
ncbi:hypothetical protein HAX54_041674 [Datura stramonium]|uniref:Uncharacterized protein n=1 Tax=Datura stramonium TaxID=4076 RepID=A0ABS8VXH6_DATST|nr:hypothetical protein [Datura stramonium]